MAISCDSKSVTQVLARFDPYVAAIDDEIRDSLPRDDPALADFYEMMLYQLGLDEHAETSGKRMRPLICLLVHEGLTGDFRPALPVAAALELLHNFTLIHDDIQDQDPTRHHRPTVWSVWGVPQAINAGDGMYAIAGSALQRLQRLGLDPGRIVDATYALDRACALVCEGQFLDISFERRADVTREHYEGMVARKTGALLRASAEIPAVLSTDNPRTHGALRSFGEHFGRAFQAHDDVRGIWASAAQTGKSEMNDIAKRKMTFPLVLAFERATGSERKDLERIYLASSAPSGPDVRRVREIVDHIGVRVEIESFIAAERTVALASLAEANLGPPSAELLTELVSEVTAG
jgi:geranylgeranyl diphosphate synthase type I